jgi:hypothetical protein
VRLISVLRGGGLFGRIGYDGSVYYASASALTHGLLPYRDFLLLHPPGIALVLLPFAALGQLVGDAYAFALARCAWFGLGAVSTALVFTVLRSRGLWPAAAAAVFYAVFVPAVTSEHTTSLEGVGSICLLGAVALLTLGCGGRTGSVAPLLVAGALLGISTGTKIWGVALVLTLVTWSVSQVGLRRAALVLAGAAGGTVAVCLPFFLAAPGPMWRMVVADQLGRRRVLGSAAGRLVDLTGLSELRGTVSTTVLVGLATVLLAIVLALAVRDRLGRLAALLLLVTSAVLLAAPPWSPPYTGLAAPAIALLFGCAVARLTPRPGRLRPAAPLAVVAGLVAYGAASLPGLAFGSHFPGHTLERVFAQAPGCVTTDDPIALIESGSLRRNLDLHCPVVLDLSGYSYDLRPGSDLHIRRSQNIQWQRFALDQLGSGQTSVVVRFRNVSGLSRRTKEAISSWPLLADIAGYQVHRPLPRNAAPPH